LRKSTTSPKSFNPAIKCSRSGKAHAVDELEKAKLDLEHEKLQGEIRAKEIELDIRRQELELKKEELRSAFWKSPLLVGIIAALIGFLSNIYANVQQARNNQILEEQKFESVVQTERIKRETSLILDAIKTGASVSAAKNLDFLIKVGFVEDTEGRIKKYLSENEKAPFLPSSQSTNTIQIDCTANIDCTSTRDCTFTAQKDTRDCRVCIFPNPISGCLQWGNDPACEAAKVAQNSIYQVEASNKKLECERLKLQEKVECELKKEFQKKVCEAGKEALGNISPTGKDSKK
jgi:hypothetical protein